MIKKIVYALVIGLIFNSIMSISYGESGLSGGGGSGLISIPPGAGSGAPTTSTYITQTSDAGLSAEQALNALSDGLLKHASGVIDQAVAGTDYINPSGISGGQTIIGGTASGDDLLLSSTSNGTKGTIGLGSLTTGLVYDEVNVRLGMGIVPITALHIDSNAADTVAVVTLENTARNIQYFLGSGSPESIQTGGIGDQYTDTVGGQLYLKISGSGNTGWESVGGTPSFKSYSLSNPGNAGTFYIGGYYAFAAAHEVLTIGGTVTRTFGTAGQAHGAHAFAVASGAGGTDLVLTVTGVSITDTGVKNDSDSEIIVADTDTASTDDYFETTKKWLGQITYTLTGSSGAFTFNYGFVKYEDFGNRNFEVSKFEVTGESRANETGLNLELLHHEAGAFTYHASAFIPNQTALVSLATDYGTNNDVASGEGFAYKRTNLNTSIIGSGSEGLIIRITTVVNNSINDLTAHIGVTLN